MNPTSRHIKNFDRQEIEFQTTIAGIKLEHPLTNAAGTCKLIGEVKALAHTATAAIMAGSITVEERESNPGETYWSGTFFSLNSRGLPNPGMSYYRRYFPEMVEITHRAGKPLFVSVAGSVSSEYATLTKLCFEKGADLVELNLSCSNLWKDERQEPIICFNLKLVREILDRIKKAVGPKEKIAVKLSPFSDPFLLKKVAKVIEQSKIVKAVTTTNTFPNALAYDDRGKPRITVRDGLASLGGPALNPIALGQVKQFRDILPEHIDVIGSGGVTTGQDVVNFRRAGAKAVQITTAILNKDPRRVFDRVLMQFVEATKRAKESPNCN